MLCSINPFSAFSTHRIAERDVSAGPSFWPPILKLAAKIASLQFFDGRIQTR
jgi:hypothetical protein